MNQAIPKLSYNAIYAKVHAMLSSLLTREDYEALANCTTISEIVNYLKAHTAYASLFQNLQANQIHRARLQMLIQKYMLEKLALLCAYEKRLGQGIHTLLLLHADIRYILLCADYFESATTGDFVHDLPLFFQKNTVLSLEKLQKARTPKDLLVALEGTLYYKTVEQVLKTPQGFSVSILENRLYNLLYQEAKKFAEKNYHSHEKEQILEVFQMRADMKMIESICRQKQYYHADLSLQNDSFFHTNVTSFTRNELQMMLKASTQNDVLSILKKTKYGKYITDKNEVIERKTQWIELQISQKNLRFSTCPALSMFSFVGILENEARNMTHIIEGIHYHVAPQDILNHLIQAETKDSFRKECM